MSAPAHSSRASDLEHHVEVVNTIRKGSSIFTQSPKDRSCDIWRENSGEVRCPSSSTSSDTLPSPASERSDELAPGNSSRDPQKTQNKNQKMDNNGSSDDRLRDLPEWLEE